MKRSEMQHRIELFIDECINRDSSTIKETAECLLDFIEGCGMRPPCKWCEDENNPSGWCESDEKCCENWEPEDEN